MDREQLGQPLRSDARLAFDRVADAAAAAARAAGQRLEERSATSLISLSRR